MKTTLLSIPTDTIPLDGAWYEPEGGAATGARLSNFKNELLGCGPFLHDDPRDRPAELFGGQTTLHLRDSYLLLPVIP